MEIRKTQKRKRVANLPAGRLGAPGIPFILMGEFFFAFKFKITCGLREYNDKP